MKKLKNKNLEYYSEKKIINPPLHVRDEFDFLFNLLPNKNNFNIVDFGSGGGRLTITLLKKGFKVIAVDIDTEANKKLKKIAKKLNLDKNLKIIQHLENNRKYEFIVGTDILHHIDIKKYFLIFKKHLKKEGKIIFSEPNPLNFSWIIFISFLLNWKEEKGIFACNYFNLKNQLKKIGFKNIKLIPFALIPPQIFYFLRLNFLNKINYFLAKLPFLNFFAYRYIVYAENN